MTAPQPPASDDGSTHPNERDAAESGNSTQHGPPSRHAADPRAAPASETLATDVNPQTTQIRYKGPSIRQPLMHDRALAPLLRLDRCCGGWQALDPGCRPH